jgi:Zn-dependent peptidase ImmA (M78 family)
MRNIYLDEQTARDIEQRTDRVLRDLGYLTGKVNLAEVRDLLQLDLHYYASDDPGLLEEVVHKLKVGAKQVIKRPALLLEVIKKFDLKALFVPDRKRILIDSTLPDLKKRWSETHEISHSLIPWHADYMLGDNRVTLSPTCHESIEAEANYGAGRLLFPAAPFLEMARSSPIDIALIKAIASHFGNTITSTLWRCVENSDGLMFGVIGNHPHYARLGEPEIDYFVRSKTYERQFGSVSEAQVFQLIRSYCNYRRTGPLGEAEVVFTDDNGAAHVFLAETFSVKHYVLTLARYVRPHIIQIPVIALAGTM